MPKKCKAATVMGERACVLCLSMSCGKRKKKKKQSKRQENTTGKTTRIKGNTKVSKGKARVVYTPSQVDLACEKYHAARYRDHTVCACLSHHLAVRASCITKASPKKRALQSLFPPPPPLHAPRTSRRSAVACALSCFATSSRQVCTVSRMCSGSCSTQLRQRRKKKEKKNTS